MLNINTVFAGELPWHVARQCGLLCNPHSESQQMFERIESKELSDDDRIVIISYAYTPTDSPEVLGWCSVSNWRREDKDQLQVNVYVHESHRNSRVATSLFACCTHSMSRSTSVAVFSEECKRIALGLRQSHEQYARCEDGFVRVGSFEGGEE
jgi:RimJ/RimL family protein N-acetyltransferase